MTRDKFQTKRGRLTLYALACGYIEKHSKDNIITKLWLEHGTYHVRRHNHHLGIRLDWQVFATLTAARKHFDATKRLAA